jgi:hypothetical protein
VTNGLLVVEMISGRLRLGVDRFEQRDPAQVPVAGDPDGRIGPTYAAFAGALKSAPLADGSTITQTINRTGRAGNNDVYARYGVTAVAYVPKTQHRIASVFWDYLNSTGLVLQDGQHPDSRLFDPPVYATGYPVSEAYWSRITAAGREQDVLIQCFERRCLTYMPENPEGWKVEMGNVGQHYHR